ncbi:MAG: AAA family ATPase, partial [Candidatus Dormibacteria bacterium]
QLLTVEGEAGMGKTELLNAWPPANSSPAAIVLRAQCAGVGGSLPLQPVLDVLHTYLRSLEDVHRRRLLAVGGPLVLPLLDWRQNAGDWSQELTGAEVGPALVFAALLRVLEHMAAESPVVLLLDDAHLATPSTVDWIHFVRGHGSGLRLLMVAARRPEEGLPIRADQVVELQPLDLAATRRVVGDEHAVDLHRRSGGNPLFLVELAAAAPGSELPTSIRESVAARCDRAGPTAAASLRTAAVIGPSIDLDLLAAVTRRPAVGLLDHLEEGVRRRILEEGGEGFRFRHALVREALAAGCSPTRQALLHREAGRALAARPRPDPLAAAHHARLGGDLELAADALVTAARMAAGQYDHAEAERLLTDAIALRDSAEARLPRARLRMLRGRYDEASHDAGVALDLGGGARSLEMAGVAAYYRRELGLARNLADRGLGMAGDAASRAGCLVLSARALHALGDVETADLRITEAVDVARSADLPSPAAVLGMIRIHQGRAAEALRVLPISGEGLDASAHLYAAFSPLHAGFMRAYALATLGRAAEALRELDTTSREVERLQVSRYIGLADAWRGWILRQLGSVEEADERNGAAAEAAARAGYVESEAYSHLDLMEGRLLAGDVAGADAQLRRAVALEDLEHAYSWRHQLRARWLRGRLCLDIGEVDEALNLATTVRRDAARLSSARYAVLGCLLEARARAAAGEPVDAADSAADLARLGDLAGLEAWWLIGEHARSLGVDAWWGLAETHAARLATATDERADAFRRYAATRLERMRTSATTGSGVGPTAASASSRRA